MADFWCFQVYVHSFIHYLTLTSPLWIPLRDSRHPGLTDHDLCRERELSQDHNAGATSETTRTWKTMHSFILTRRILKDEYDGQMIFGDLVGLKLPDIWLTGEEKPRKKPHTGNLSRAGIESGPAAWQARMLPPVPQRWASIGHVQLLFNVDHFFKRRNILNTECS